MSPADSPSVTRLLRAWGGGDGDALSRLVPLVYEELRRRARQHMAREHWGIILQPTALGNEAYLRLVDGAQVQWQDRAHFFAVPSRIMRGLSLQETAKGLKISEHAVGRDWNFAKAWLAHEVR